MPKHGITALVDFIEPFEAKKAFTKLAYSQFKHVPLYLEWAPENVFLKSVEKSDLPDRIEESTKTKDSKENNLKASTKETKDSKQKNPETNTKEKENKQTIKNDAVEHMEEEETEEPENDTTLFVKNLNFRTTEAELKSVSIVLTKT